MQKNLECILNRKIEFSITCYLYLKVTNLINKVKKLIKAKYFYSRPTKKKILFFDGNNIGIIKKYFGSNSYETLYVRGENLNVSIILKMFLNLKFSFKHYIYFYIQSVDPKVIITFTDNSIFFYKFKKLFPKIKFIAIQNGYRTKNKDIFSELKKMNNSKNELKADYIFSFGKATSSEYSKYIDSKNIELGSFKNNLVSIPKESRKKNNVLFISQFREADLNHPNYYCTERQLLPLVGKFCKIHNFNLSIAGASYTKSFEREYFSKILRDFKFKFIRRKSFLSNYELLHKFSIIVFIDSTLGYEAIARNKKIAVFSTRKIQSNDPGSPFGWPKTINKKGFFYSNVVSEKEVFRVFKNVSSTSKNMWRKKTRKIFEGIINYNFNNKKFFKIINENI